MKTFNSIISFTLFGLFIASCQPQQVDPRFAEAYEYHQQAGNVRENLGQQISNVEGDSLMQAAVLEFNQALNEWDEAWVEVPGFEHDHDHEHGADEHHHHNSAPNLSAAEHLELQKHLLEEIKQLEKSFNERRKELAN